MKSAIGVLAGMVIAVLASWIGFNLRLNLAAIGFVQLLVVLLISMEFGFLQATLVSIVANGCLLYFFVPPIFTFAISDPKNWVALLVFELSALLVSRLATEAQKQTLRARAHQAESERLYDVSRQLLLLTRNGPPAPQILALIERVFGVDAAVLFDGSETTIDVIGTATTEFEAQAKSAYFQDRNFESADGTTWIRVLRLGVRSVGVLGLRGMGLTTGIINALAALSVTALERARSVERETRADAERQTEQLRTTVLDALAHEYKTPLTVIRTAASGLIEMGARSSTESELLSFIDAEVTHLSNLTTRLLQMSRLEKDHVQVRHQRIDLEELIETVLYSTKSVVAGHRINLRSDGKRTMILADRELVSMALAQFLDNAAKYSDPTSVITISTKVLIGEVQISVHNLGPRIAAEDRQRIFQRFYRIAQSSHMAAGTGIGLSISKRVADAHQGRVWVTSEEGQGNTFFFVLPLKTT
jgi:two-component system sensor histidine kinase KdpD